MKRYIMIVVAASTFSALAYDYQTIHGQQPETRRGVPSQATPALAETPKGKELVEKLPEGAEGVVLEKGVVKAKPGYKFVTKDKQVMVTKIGTGGAGGGRGISGGWNCNCAAGGSTGCEVHSDENVVYCTKSGSACSDKCVMSITIKGVKSQILQY